MREVGMTDYRFKIAVDYKGDLGLYKLQGYTWFRNKPIWYHLMSFQTIDDARAHYKRIKDLPEYLR